MKEALKKTFENIFGLKMLTVVLSAFGISFFCFSVLARAAGPDEPTYTPLAARVGRASAQLEILQQQLDVLLKVSDKGPESPFGMRHDQVQATRAQALAQSHLDNGNAARSLFLAQEDVSAADPFDALARTKRLRLTYESLRALGEHAHAARVCLSALRLSGKTPVSSGENVFDEVWNLNCALDFAYGVGPEIPSQLRITREEFDTFAYVTALRRDFPRILSRSVVLASGFANQGRTREALDFLNEDALHAPANAVGMPRLLFTRALLLFQLGKTEEALAVFRRLAEEDASAKQNAKIAPNERSDDAVRRMAQIQLARIFYARGQFPAAESWYRLAAAPQHTQKADAFALSVKWEFALSLYAQKKYDESFALLKDFIDVHLLADSHPAPSLFEKQALKYRLTALQAAKALTRSPQNRTAAREHLTVMLAFADADSLFVRQNKSQKSELGNFDENLEILRALLAIAAQYEIKTADLKKYTTLTSTLRSNVSDLRSFRFQLAHVLTPADFADTGILDAHAHAVFAQLLLSQQKLSAVFWELDVVSKSLWDPDSSSTLSAAKHREEIKRRFTVLDDLVSHVKVSQKQASQFDLLKSNAARVAGAWASVRQTRARIASLKSLAQRVQAQQLEGTMAPNAGLKMLASEEPALLAEVAQLEEKASAALMEQRLLSLKSEMPDFKMDRTKECLAVTSESFRSLQALHVRVRKQSAGPTDDEFFDRLDAAWTLALIAQKQILGALDQVLNNARSERRALLADVDVLLAVKKTQDQGIERMKALLAAEGQKWISDVSVRIEKGVREYRNQVRIALAAADSRQADEVTKQNADFARATEERKRWLQSLRQSVDWGLAR